MWSSITNIISGENGILGGITDIVDRFTMSKEEKLKMKLELEKFLKEKEAMYLADVQNARAMQVAALNQKDLFSKRFLYYLAGTSILIGFIYVFLITFLEVPQANQRFADTILGVVISTVFGLIYNFFFGSSQGSQVKTHLINENVKSITNHTLTRREKRKLKRAEKAIKP